MNPLPRPQIEPSALARRYAQVRAQSLALGRAAERGRRAGAVDARRQPRQVASGARDLVLRNLRARAPRARLQAVPSALSRAVQQLLQPGGRTASARAARPGVAAEPGRGQGLPRAGRPAHGGAAGDVTRPDDRFAGRARPAARTATPGAAAHRHQARAVVQPAGAGVPRVVAAGHGGAAGDGLGRAMRLGWSRSATTAPDSRSTTRARGISSNCGRTRSATG